MRVLIPLTNRMKPEGQGFELPEDGWYHIAPLGEFPHSESELLQVIDKEACDAMAANFQEGDELLIDFEHESHNPELRTEAAGWIVALQSREDGLWMQPRWSRLGQEALTGGVYRFISPVWYEGECEQLDASRIRPRRLSDAGLTNSPNLKGLVPLSNRAAAASAATQNKTTTMNHKELLIKLLGLPADATDEQIATAAAAAGNLMADGKKLPEVQEALANADMDALGIKDEEERKDVKPMLVSNRKGTLALLKNRVLAPATPAREVRVPLTNRDKAGTPGAAVITNKSKDARQKEAIHKAKLANRGCTNEEAYRAAKLADPEAFAPDAD